MSTATLNVHSIRTLKHSTQRNDTISRQQDAAEPSAESVMSVQDGIEDAGVSVRVLKLILAIVGAMALGALAASMTVLGSATVVLGFFVAFLMMLFIGLPLILASVADAVEAHEC